MNNELRESFSNILRQLMAKGFECSTKDGLLDTGMAMINLKKVAMGYCDCESYEFLALVINAQHDENNPKVNIDEHNNYCKLIDILHNSGLDINLLW